MYITIKDIARKADTSVATVSRVLNNSSKVAPETRERILAVLKEFNYKPNQIAKGLVKGRSNTISLITPTSDNFFNAFYFREVFLGINRAAENAGYNIMVDPSSRRINESIRGRFPIDGCVLVSPAKDDPLLKHIEEENIPALLINTRSPKISWVDLDNISSACEVVKHLIGLGHREIAVVKGKENVQNSSDRFKGYLKALKEHGIKFNEDYAITGDFFEEKAYLETKKKFSRIKKATAVFACNDNMALGVIRALEEKGLSVPSDVSVAGFDDINLASYFSPPLTTVRQPFYMMGIAGVRTLVQQIEGEIPAHSGREFHGEVIVRASTAAR